MIRSPVRGAGLRREKERVAVKARYINRRKSGRSHYICHGANFYDAFERFIKELKIVSFQVEKEPLKERIAAIRLGG